MQWLTTDLNGEFILTLLVSMLPVVELRGGIPFGVAAGLPVWAAYLAAVIGNLLPVPFIVVYIQRIFMFMRQNMPRLNSVVDKMEQKAHLKSASVLKYQYLGLAIFVAIPLPGTGAWTGALVAAFLDMRLKKAMPSIMGGVLSAGLIISILSYGVKSLF
ncbi:small multi-drug export protein [Pseudoflavonifractor capillosus]|nr:MULTISPECIES: small multi-drug export protein [Pseudoflavonifractor]MBM6694264.1 small multi-drug export protein [Pseudoflavonifractor capillosus]OUN98584.1 small multidrug export protein [Pseudoflavonifractor sp. An44]